MTCPDCGCREHTYRRDGSWLAVLCAGCWLELHGIDVARLDVKEVADEAA